MKMSLVSRMVAYSAATFGFSVLSSTFSFYYVKVFLNIYQIPENWFHMAQILYLVWNAINDPLFAYCQDTSSSWLTRTRREILLYTGPLFGLSYLIAWFPWAQSSWLTGLHLIVALCLYDTMFTFIGLALCCLFTEIAITETERIRLTRLSQIGSFVASFSVTLCEFSSNSLKNFANFQGTTVFIAIMSACGMYYSGKHAHTHYDLKNVSPEESGESTEKDEKSSYWKLTREIVSNTNFVSFVICNFCQELHRIFIISFTAIICDQLVEEQDVPQSIRSFFYGSITAVSSILVITVGAPLVNKIGYVTVVRWNFRWKVISGILMALVGRHHPWIFMLFLLMDSGYANMSCSFYNMALSDVADENMETYNRKHPMTSMVFGTNALITKPAQSLSPMFVVAILNKYGYDLLKKGTLEGEKLSSLKDIMFVLTWSFPLIVGAIQMFTWSFFAPTKRKSIELSID